MAGICIKEFVMEFIWYLSCNQSCKGLDGWAGFNKIYNRYILSYILIFIFEYCEQWLWYVVYIWIIMGNENIRAGNIKYSSVGIIVLEFVF